MPRLPGEAGVTAQSLYPAARVVLWGIGAQAPQVTLRSRWCCGDRTLHGLAPVSAAATAVEAAVKASVAAHQKPFASVGIETNGRRGVVDPDVAGSITNAA